MAERRIDLPSGGWAMLRDPASVPNKERTPILARVEADGAESSSLVTKLDFVDRIVMVLVKEWSYPLPIPKESVESLEEVGGLDLDQLRLAVMDPESHLWLDTTINPDPKASTGSSGNSNGALHPEALKVARTSPPNSTPIAWSSSD